MIRIAIIIASIFLFLFSIDLMSDSFRHLGKEAIESILKAASNPFIGLFIGLLITALIQSSSTSTTLIVAAVASGSISLIDAVPMIMGANIGTTITSTIISLSYIGNREQFRRALSAGVVHDFFNILVVLILFPLELKYEFLSSIADTISSTLIGVDTTDAINHTPFKLIDFSPITRFYTSIIDIALINLIFSFILLFASIKILSRIISKLLIGESEEKLQKYIFTNTGMSFLWGTFLTSIIQSSSISTSLVIPFVATDKISLRKITPFIIGANVGTTITAFIAVFFKSYELVSIAIVHLTFNLIGVLIFLPFPWLREIPIRMAEKFSELAANYRFTVIIYILLIFFIIPFCLIYFTKGFEGL
ncbi:Na/Pi symporter [Fulvivirga kasyanovii]|uniref:Na/Pi symporter n=1 Tax=Fulvivirga kasyanovii TaxID=396812 RepID=UPI001FE75C4F|nr:Na/Pi symporter [Fulvivirga kasyanovii]